MRAATATPPPASSAVSIAFEHDAVVLAQVEECLRLSPSRMFARIAETDQADEKIREETIVMLVREYSRQGRKAIAWKLMQSICERVSLSLNRSIRLWRLTPVVADEVVESVLSNLYESILNTEDSERFWEIRFWVCFDRYLLSTLRRHRTYGDKLLGPGSSEIGIRDISTTGHEKTLDWQDPALRAIVAEALGQLPEHFRTAFMLKHWAGFPEYSLDPNDKATIAAVLGVSDRTVRNYLSRAEEILNGWRTGKPRLRMKGTGK